MKAKVIFNLDDIDDQYKFKKFVKSDDMTFVLFELIYNTKKSIEYEIDNNSDLSNYEVLDLVYERFNKILEERNINIDELIY